jgi:hypothetical protein
VRVFRNTFGPAAAARVANRVGVFPVSGKNPTQFGQAVRQVLQNTRGAGQE